MDNFDNPDPFNHDEQQRDTHDLAAQSAETETYDHALSPAAVDRVRSRSATSKSSRKSSKRAQSTGSTTDHPHLDKFKTAIDDVQSGVVDKVRTIGHRFHLDGVHAQGVSRFLNPTTIRMNVRYQSDSDSHGQPGEGQELLWRARDNRKGRNSIAVPSLPMDGDDDVSFLPLRYTPRMSSKLSDIAHNLYRMATTFPY